MGKIKTQDLIGAALDWAVAKSQQMHVIFRGIAKEVQIYHPNLEWVTYKPSTDWSQGGPIIEREITKLFKNIGKTYTAQIRYEEDHPLVQHKVLIGWLNCAGPTLLIAAMRCYVASKLGDEVEVPDELL